MEMGAVKVVVEVLTAETIAVVLMVRWGGGDGDTGKVRVSRLHVSIFLSCTAANCSNDISTFAA